MQTVRSYQTSAEDLHAEAHAVALMLALYDLLMLSADLEQLC